MTVRKVKHEDTVVVEMTVSEWRKLEERAFYTAEKGKDWTVVNMLNEVFDLLVESKRNGD